MAGIMFWKIRYSLIRAHCLVRKRYTLDIWLRWSSGYLLLPNKPSPNLMASNSKYFWSLTNLSLTRLIIAWQIFCFMLSAEAIVIWRLGLVGISRWLSLVAGTWYWLSAGVLVLSLATFHDGLGFLWYGGWILNTWKWNLHNGDIDIENRLVDLGRERVGQIERITWEHILWKVKKVKVKFSQMCPILCNPMDCSPPGSSVHEIPQARILEWVAILFSRKSSWPRDRTWISCIACRFFTVWATREAYTFSMCKIDSRWEFAVSHSKLSSTQCSCDNCEGWYEKGDVRGVQEGGMYGHIYTFGWVMLMYGRNQHNTVKQLFPNWEKKSESCRSSLSTCSLHSFGESSSWGQSRFQSCYWQKFFF